MTIINIECNLLYSQYEISIGDNTYYLSIKRTEENTNEYKITIYSTNIVDNYYDTVIVNGDGEYVTGCKKLLRQLIDYYILPPTHNKLSYKDNTTEDYIKLLMEDNINED